MRTRAVDTRTTLLLARYRFHLDLPGRDGARQLIAEDAHVIAFRGSPENPEWLSTDEVAQLLDATPDANVPGDQARELAARVIDRLNSLNDPLSTRADELAEALLESHRRVRAGAGAAKRGLAVRAQKPVDILGVYVYLPVIEGPST